MSTLQDEPLLLTHCAHAHCLQFEHSGNGLMSHIRETSKVTINTSYFHPAHQHYTDEAQKAETVPSVVVCFFEVVSGLVKIFKKLKICTEFSAANFNLLQSSILRRS